MKMEMRIRPPYEEYIRMENDGDISTDSGVYR
jgi:hypothetical protein